MAEQNSLKLESEDDFLKKESLSQRLDDFAEKETAYLQINGGARISGNIEESLKLLTENIFPKLDNLPTIIRRAVETRDKQGRSLEEIWQEKIQQGANFIGVLNGVFHFFKDEEILSEDNVDLKVSALPRILRMREVERQKIYENTRLEMSALRANLLENNNEQSNNLNGDIEIIGNTNIS